MSQTAELLSKHGITLTFTTYTNFTTRIKKKDAFVYSTITSPDYPTTNIVWRIRERNTVPKVIDMQVEGVSLLRTKKNDFAMILNQVGLEGLIEKLDEMNKISDLKIPGE